MRNKNFKILLVIFLITGSLYFIFIGLTSGKSFLMPVVTAIILAMVMAPVVAKFQQWGVKKGWAVFFADLIVVAFIAFMVFLLVAQANQVANNWSQIENRLKPKLEQAQNYFQNKLNISSYLEEQQQQQNIEQGQQQDQGDSEVQQQNQSQEGPGQQGPQEQQEQQQNNDRQLQLNQIQGQDNQDQQNKQEADSQQQQSSIPGVKQQSGNNTQKTSPASLDPQSIQNLLTGIIKNVFSFITDLLLVLVYIFFFLYYSKKFRDTITGMVKEDKREKTKKILAEISKTAQHYLFGRFMLIFILAVLYAIGWSILGLEYALFISVIAALFSLVPYIGNILALFLATGMSFLSGDNGGGTGQIIGIVVVFSVIQFVESYLLEPYVVGHEVDVNPVMVIVGVVLGGIVWGAMGMILSIPILAIIKVVFDNIESLRPLGYALDERDLGSDDHKQDRIKEWFKNKLK